MAPKHIPDYRRNTFSSLFIMTDINLKSIIKEVSPFLTTYLTLSIKQPSVTFIQSLKSNLYFSINLKPALYCSRFDLVEFQKSFIIVCVRSLIAWWLDFEEIFYSNFTLKVIAFYPSQTNNYLQTDPRKTKKGKKNRFNFITLWGEEIKINIV